MQAPDSPVLTPDERVFHAIYEAVQAQRLAPGVKLKEVELTELFKVSRTSVRTALRRLAHKGVVNIVPNRGATVAQPSAEDCRQLFEARRAAEGAIVDILATSPSAEAIKALRSQVKAQRAAFRAGDERAGHDLAIGFHRLLAELAGNRLLAQFVDDLLARMPLVILTLARPHTPASRTTDDAAEHEALVEAIAAGDAVTARRLLAAHLQHVENELEDSRPDSNRTLGQMLAL